jgi:2-keto-4-pentenoate hydratase/2-oxohepta-3-ene-1,7-dioic acid hydratase in catechol pathway
MRIVTAYVRYRSAAGGSSYGILEGDSVREIRGTPLDGGAATGAVRPLAGLELLPPSEPTKILAVGLNYLSHLGSRPQPAHPELFYKPVSALQSPGGPIRIPRDATDVHFEGELVIVIGRRVSGASPEQARNAIFGATCGNDVSERNWQHGAGKDLQWWRAKGCDTFAPLGPVLAAGIDCGNLTLRTRLNGETVQNGNTADLIFDCPSIVSWASQWVTLEPGDLIYTGTPGSTRRLSPGDVVEVEIGGIGLLRNPVV